MAARVRTRARATRSTATPTSASYRPYIEDLIKIKNLDLPPGPARRLLLRHHEGRNGRASHWAPPTESSRPIRSCRSRTREPWRRLSTKTWFYQASDATTPWSATSWLSIQGYPCLTSPLTPGTRNEYHAGLQQAFGRFLVISGEYIWKYTDRAYDFSVFANTPITYPIEWAKSKIPGVRGARQHAEFSRLQRLHRDVSRRGAFLRTTDQRNRHHADQFRRRRRLPHRSRREFSTRPPICSIRLASEVRGLASTGVMTAAWSRALYLAPAEIARMGRMGTITPWTSPA